MSVDLGTVKRCQPAYSRPHTQMQILTPQASVTSVARLIEGLATGWVHFRTESALDGLLETAREQSNGAFDAVLLFSGGKDSTYALYRLHDLQARVLAFTFDNGFISPAAIENISRIVNRLGVEHRFIRHGTTGSFWPRASVRTPRYAPVVLRELRCWAPDWQKRLVLRS